MVAIDRKTSHYLTTTPQEPSTHAPMSMVIHDGEDCPGCHGLGELNRIPVNDGANDVIETAGVAEVAANTILRRGAKPSSKKSGRTVKSLGAI